MQYTNTLPNVVCIDALFERLHEFVLADALLDAVREYLDEGERGRLNVDLTANRAENVATGGVLIESDGPRGVIVIAIIDFDMTHDALEGGDVNIYIYIYI